MTSELLKKIVPNKGEAKKPFQCAAQNAGVVCFRLFKSSLGAEPSAIRPWFLEQAPSLELGGRHTVSD